MNFLENSRQEVSVSRIFDEDCRLCTDVFFFLRGWGASAHRLITTFQLVETPNKMVGLFCHD